MPVDRIFGGPDTPELPKPPPPIDPISPAVVNRDIRTRIQLEDQRTNLRDLIINPGSETGLNVPKI